MPTAEEVAQAIKAGVEKLLSGEMSKTEYETFLAKSNAELDALALKKRQDEDWYRYSLTFCLGMGASLRDPSGDYQTYAPLWGRIANTSCLTFTTLS